MPLLIRLTVPSIAEEDLDAVSTVLRSGRLVQGEWVMEFEKAVANYVGTRFAVAVSSGTAALHLALLALDVRAGDIVAVTSYSWPATANVVELCGAKPVFIDIEKDTFNMSPESLRATLERLLSTRETAKRVKAVLPVHTFGLMANMPAILEIAAKYELPLIEDAACALGASIDSRKAGSWGTMGCFSFHPRKAITTGEGGIVTTNDAELVSKLQALRNHGLDPLSATPDFIIPGFNYRMTEFQAALGLAQLSKLERIISARTHAAAIYDSKLQASAIRRPSVPPRFRHAYQSYVCLLPNHPGLNRDEVISQMKNAGIETAIGTYHIPSTTYFRNKYHYRAGEFPVSDSVSTRSITLPLYEAIEQKSQYDVMRALNQLTSERQESSLVS